MKEWKTRSVASLEEVGKNLANSLRRGLPILDVGPPLPQSVAVVGGGPSIALEVEALKSWQGFIVAINGAHDWLLDHGITPDGMIVLDPQACMVRYLDRANEHTTYLVASCCAPEVFDRLKGKRVVLWHAMQGEQVPDAPGYFIWGGPTAMSRAPHLMHMFGFRDIHLFGADSSVGSSGTHAYSHPLSRLEAQIPVRCGEQIFITDTGMAMQAEWLYRAVQEAPADTKITIRGAGLASAIVRENGEFQLL